MYHNKKIRTMDNAIIHKKYKWSIACTYTHCLSVYSNNKLPQNNQLIKTMPDIGDSQCTDAVNFCITLLTYI